MANLQAQHMTERFEAAEDRQKAFETAMAEMRRKMAEMAEMAAKLDR